jgi:hypothetical protein
LCLSSVGFAEAFGVKFGVNSPYNLSMRFAMPSGPCFTLLTHP